MIRKPEGELRAGQPVRVDGPAGGVSGERRGGMDKSGVTERIAV